MFLSRLSQPVFGNCFEALCQKSYQVDRTTPSISSCNGYHFCLLLGSREQSFVDNIYDYCMWLLEFLQPEAGISLGPDAFLCLIRSASLRIWIMLISRSLDPLLFVGSPDLREVALSVMPFLACLTWSIPLFFPWSSYKVFLRGYPWALQKGFLKSILLLSFMAYLNSALRRGYSSE